MMDTLSFNNVCYCLTNLINNPESSLELQSRHQNLIWWIFMRKSTINFSICCILLTGCRFKLYIVKTRGKYVTMSRKWESRGNTFWTATGKIWRVCIGYSAATFSEISKRIVYCARIVTFSKHGSHYIPPSGVLYYSLIGGWGCVKWNTESTTVTIDG